MPETNILKVSVLANSELLLEGRPVTLEQLAEGVKQGAADKAAVWYYRENASGPAPPVAMQVMKLIGEHGLQIRLSSRADFSDSVTPGQADWEQLFGPLREKAAQRQLVVLRPDGEHVLIPALEKAPPELRASVEKMLPSSAQRNVAVLAETGWTMTPQLSLEAAKKAIPFLGMLLGFATIGHAVWVFNSAAAEVVGAACREADLLVVDSAFLVALPKDWQTSARKLSRNLQIVVHDRVTYQLRNV